MTIDDTLGPRRLPTFNGYTVDDRLREFRKFNFGEMPEIISFDSPEGEKMLKEYHKFMKRLSKIDWERRR